MIEQWRSVGQRYGGAVEWLSCDGWTLWGCSYDWWIVLPGAIVLNEVPSIFTNTTRLWVNTPKPAEASKLFNPR